MEEEVHTYFVSGEEDGDVPKEDEEDEDEDKGKEIEEEVDEADEIGTTLRVWPRQRSQALGMGAGYDDEDNAYFIPHTLTDLDQRKALWDAFGVADEEQCEEAGGVFDDPFGQDQTIEVPMVLIKTDTAASLETVLGMVEEIDVISMDRLTGDAGREDNGRAQENTADDGTTIPALSVIHAGVGPVTSTDIKIALVEKSPIYCFNVSLSGGRKIKDEARRVDIFRHDIIDDLFTNMLADAGITAEAEGPEYSED
jgi:translation initiation factor IF-2